MLPEPPYFATEAKFRRWLEANHETAADWIMSAKKPETGAKPPKELIDVSGEGRRFPRYDCQKKP